MEGAGGRGAGTRMQGGGEPVFVEWCIAASISNTMSRRKPVPTDVDVDGLVVVGRTNSKGKRGRRTGLIGGAQASDKGTE